jgi:hypothetical protein
MRVIGEVFVLAPSGLFKDSELLEALLVAGEQ